MGLMAIIEMESRRDLITLEFARRRSRGGQPPRRTREVHLAQPQSPNWGPKIPRGVLIVGGAAAVGVALLRPWEWFTPQPEPEGPETLESLVAQAINLENTYKGKDLSDLEPRNEYAKLLAEIFVRYNEEQISGDQLFNSIVWMETAEEFERIFFEEEGVNITAERLRHTLAFTADGKIYLNLSSPAFQQKTIDTDPALRGFNPLKQLRLALFHDFYHVVTEDSQDDSIFAIVDPQNQKRNKKNSGFRILGMDNRGILVGLYENIHEATAELLSKQINQDLFGSFHSDYPSSGEKVTDTMLHLALLLEAAQIPVNEVRRMYKQSSLKEFLLLLSERGGINPQRVSERDRILFGFAIFEALIKNNQIILQDYMNSARGLPR